MRLELRTKKALTSRLEGMCEICDERIEEQEPYYSIQKREGSMYFGSSKVHIRCWKDRNSVSLR